MDEKKTVDSALAVRWLRVLMYVTVVCIASSVVSVLFDLPQLLTNLISYGANLAVLRCCFRLAPVGARYRKAAVMRAAMLACTVVVDYILSSALLTGAASVLSIVAIYHEYHAHGELMADRDAPLSARWDKLFWMNVGLGILGFFISMITAVLAMFGNITSSVVVTFVAAAITIPQIILYVMYMQYLKRMINSFNETPAE